MKTGVIIYVLEKNEQKFTEDNLWKLSNNLNLKADKIEVVMSGDNKFDIMDAWWKLTTKGMNKIVCVLTEMTNDTQLQLTGKELRLCG